MMPEGSRGWLAIVVVSLFAFSSVVAPTPASGSSQTTPACTDAVKGPVIQDSGPEISTVPSGNTTIKLLSYTTSHSGPSVMLRDGQYVMWLQMQANNSEGIYRATSKNGVDWSISASAVLPTGPAGSWDHATVFAPSTAWNGTGYVMYYTGDGGNTSAFRQIGVAFSSDGIRWTKYSGNPVITHGPGIYDSQYTRWPSVIYDDGLYKMWYWGSAPYQAPYFLKSSIDYATSPDGVHWTKFAGNPVFYGFYYKDNTTSSDYPSVVKVNGTYLMAFSAYGVDIGLARSSDGINWQFNNQTDVLLDTSGWHNSTVVEPSLLVQGSRVQLWYFGAQSLSNFTAPYASGIGFATCGILVASNPVTTITSTTTTATVTKGAVSTSISTSTMTATVVENPGAPLVEVVTSFVIGVAVALALTVALISVRLRSKGAH